VEVGSVDSGSAQAARLASGSSTFSRSASGLIRVAGSWDVFIYNVGLVSVGIAIAFNQFYGPSLYPGAMVWLSTLLATLGMVAAAGTFYFWSVIFPRSGGVYVSLSRSTTASLAFVLSVVESVILLYYGALAASLVVKVGLAPCFATIGSVAGNSTLVDWANSVSTQTGVFCIGTGLLLTAGLLLTSGTRRYFTSQKILFAIAAVGTLIVLVVLLLGSHSEFEGNFQHLTGLSVAGVIATAKVHGFTTAPHDFWESVKFLVWPLTPLLGAMQSVALGGEIKKVNRNQLLGMLGAVIATGVVIALFSIVASQVFGDTFQGAVAFNSVEGLSNASTEGSMGAAPYFPVLAGILTNSVVLSIIIMATFLVWVWFWIPAQIAYTTRSMIAWSFDKLAPNQLGFVSKRFNTPVIAIWISTALSIVFMWAIAYKEVNLLTLIEPLLIVWGTAMFVAIVFPFTGRQFFRASSASAYKIGRVPLMSITGVLAVAFFILAFVLLWTDKIAAGPLIGGGHISTDLWIVIVTVAAAILWYAGNALYRRREGVDVALAFKEIPIE
jgi:amino acid transporter